MYDCEPCEPYAFYVWTPINHGGLWERKYCTTKTTKIYCGQEFDEPLTFLVDRLSKWLEAIPSANIQNATLILALRTATEWDDFQGWYENENMIDRHGVLVMGSFAFVERHPNEISLDGIALECVDPTYHIEQICLGLAGKAYDVSVAQETLNHYFSRKKALKEEDDRRLARAKAILTSVLNKEQCDELDSSGSFHIVGADGNRYLITDKCSHNVFMVDGGEKKFEYCIVSDEFVPSHDQMLAQMLLLKSNPTMFHKIANTWAIENGERVFVPKSN